MCMPIEINHFATNPKGYNYFLLAMFCAHEYTTTLSRRIIMPKKNSRKAPKKGGCTYGSGVSGAARKRRPASDSKSSKSKSKSKSRSRKSHSRKHK